MVAGTLNPVFYLTVGDRLPKLRAHLLDREDDGTYTAVALGGSDVVKFKMSPVGAGDAVVALGSVTVLDATDADGALVEYAWAAADVDAAGDYEAQFVVQWGGDATQTTHFPRNEPIKVRIRESA